MPIDKYTKPRQSHLLLRKGPLPGTAEHTEMALHGVSESTKKDAGNVNLNAARKKEEGEDK